MVIAKIENQRAIAPANYGDFWQSVTILAIVNFLKDSKD